MSNGDYSRRTFDPVKNYTSVLMQQGRVQLDSDWNELAAILERRFQAQAADILGPCVVPSKTPNGFEIKQEPSKGYTIGLGRIYVDGLLAENHGSERTQDFDPVLAEGKSKHPVPYESQPYLAKAEPPPRAPFVFYLDVWQREVTWLEDPDLLETAVGVDTTTRLQTVWQVRTLEVSKETTGGNIQEDDNWIRKAAPSAARLSTPKDGYLGGDNRLYRVEIHKSGPAGTATFKWSRDNAAMATSVRAIKDARLTVDRTEWDEVRRFAEHDWVELTDDWHEFDGKPGLLKRVKSVEDEPRWVELDASQSELAEFTIEEKQRRIPQHIRLRRWDSPGEAPVPPEGTSVTLEEGVQVTFNTPSGQEYRTGECWLFAVRANGSIEELILAPPRGIHHHYGCLAWVDANGGLVNCRSFWPRPPEIRVEHKDARREDAIQELIDDVIRKGGGTISLGRGTYALATPLIVKGASSFRLRGGGPETVLYPVNGKPAVVVVNSVGVTIEDLAICTKQQAIEAGIAPATGPLRDRAAAGDEATGGTGAPPPIDSTLPAVAICLLNQSEATIKGCDFFVRSVVPTRANSWNTVVGLGGALMGVAVHDCHMPAEYGIGAIPNEVLKQILAAHGLASQKLSLEALFVQGNRFRYTSRCIDHSRPRVQTFFFSNNECLLVTKPAGVAVAIEVGIRDVGLAALSGNLLQGQLQLWRRGWFRRQLRLKSRRTVLTGGLLSKILHPLWHNLNAITK